MKGPRKVWFRTLIEFSFFFVNSMVVDGLRGFRGECFRFDKRVEVRTEGVCYIKGQKKNFTTDGGEVDPLGSVLTANDHCPCVVRLGVETTTPPPSTPVVRDGVGVRRL